jgi:hypothetical protein
VSNSPESNPEAETMLREELKSSPPSTSLRAVAEKFGLHRSALGFLAADVYENIMTPEVQAIWHWDLSEKGVGHSDEELDELLSHLVLSSERPSAV